MAQASYKKDNTLFSYIRFFLLGQRFPVTYLQSDVMAIHFRTRRGAS